MLRSKRSVAALNRMDLDTFHDFLLRAGGFEKEIEVLHYLPRPAQDDLLTKWKPRLIQKYQRMRGNPRRRTRRNSWRGDSRFHRYAAMMGWRKRLSKRRRALTRLSQQGQNPRRRTRRNRSRGRKASPYRGTAYGPWYYRMGRRAGKLKVTHGQVGSSTERMSPVARAAYLRGLQSGYAEAKRNPRRRSR